MQTFLSSNKKGHSNALSNSHCIHTSSTTATFYFIVCALFQFFYCTGRNSKTTRTYTHSQTYFSTHTMTISAVGNVPNTKLQTINIIRHGCTNTQIVCRRVRVLGVFSPPYAFTAYSNLLAFYTSFDLGVISLFFPIAYTILYYQKGSTSVV